MKFSVGLPKNDPAFTDLIAQNAKSIYEVYFSWGDFPNGRSSQTNDAELLPWELIDIQKQNLRTLCDAGIPLNILFNANCYGKESLSKSFFNSVGDTVDYIKTNYRLDSVTTTSPLIAKFIKANFEGVATRASVNMEIGSVEGMEYLAQYFDGYYVKRELNRNLSAVKPLYEWSSVHGKKLFMLANSGCLNFCSAHNFHDNLVAHERDIAAMDNAYSFNGICREFLKNEENYKKLINYTNFVRPEDIEKYTEYFEAAKLATRVHKNPRLVLSSYINAKYSGDILKLLEPEHSIYPYVIENGDPLKLIKLDTQEGFLC
ncbi:MAG: hypothetical protein IKV97_01410 [Clostridia bacterium]|nr:hypothetical protein [Clostridia bacterium]